MKVFIKYHPYHAGAWIYQGYKNAWDNLGGFETVYYNSLNELESQDLSDSLIMAIDYDIRTKFDVKILSSAKKTFLFVLPTNFPSPWGTHPNWISSCKFIEQISSCDSIITWSFLEQCEEYFVGWKNLVTIPLAFDDIAYANPLKREELCYDICYVGGFANNGFDEKRKIMMGLFEKISKMKIKCGIFINQNVSHEFERDLLKSSKLAINIHDQYQNVLGLDTNERTFKSLGLNGFLVSEKNLQIQRLFPNLKLSSDYEEYCEHINEALSNSKLPETKDYYRKEIIENHCYKNRVQSLLNYV